MIAFALVVVGGVGAVLAFASDASELGRVRHGIACDLHLAKCATP